MSAPHSTTTTRLRLLFERRWTLVLVATILSVVLGVAAGRVRADYSIEQIFPRFDHSRVDYERYKKDFPFEDAQAVVIIEAADLFEATGLARIAALEDDMARIPGVVDTQSLTSIRDVTSDGETLTMQKLFPSPDLPPDDRARQRIVATTDPLFRWSLATPDGRATTLLVTLTPEVASKEEARSVFYRQARAIVNDHEARARAQGVPQKLVLSGLPVVRSEFTELINHDLSLLFPIALAVILAMLYVTFRSLIEVAAALVTIVFSVVWTTGVMGAAHVPIHMLTQVTPIVVMIVSISDTVHVIAHVKDELRSGRGLRDAVAHAAADNAIPCLLTEVTIALGFVALAVNDMQMIQQFGLVTAAGVILTWVANFTVLPLALSVFGATPTRRRLEPSAAARAFAWFVAWIERVVTTRARTVVAVAAAITVVCGLLGLRVGREFFFNDDLRHDSRIWQDLRQVEAGAGGSVPLAVYIEPKGEAGKRAPDAMLEPEALALMARITQKLETDYPDDVKTARSLSKYLAKAHMLLAGEEVARQHPLPTTRRLAAQELLAIDDPRALRDVVSFDRSTAAVFAILPDKGSSHGSKMLAALRAYLDQEHERTGYRLTLTGTSSISDAIYRGLVGGLSQSLGLSVLASFGVFFVVLRSWRLAAIALVPNVLPLVLTLGMMSLMRIDLKPSTVIIFSITLVIADDDTIQYLSRWRDRFVDLRRQGHSDPHTEASLSVLRQAGLPMFVTTCAVSLGFLVLLLSQFLGLAHLGLLTGLSLLAAVFADLFLTPLLLIRLKPKP